MAVDPWGPLATKTFKTMSGYGHCSFDGLFGLIRDCSGLFGFVRGMTHDLAIMLKNLFHVIFSTFLMELAVFGVMR